MMDQDQIVKQMTDFQKSALDNSAHALEMLQSRGEKMMRMFWDQAAWASDKSGTVLLDWTRAWETGFESFQKAVEANSSKLCDFGFMPK